MIDLVDLIVVSAHVRILNIESLVLLGAKLMILKGSLALFYSIVLPGMSSIRWPGLFEWEYVEIDLGRKSCIQFEVVAGTTGAEDIVGDGTPGVESYLQSPRQNGCDAQ